MHFSNCGPQIYARRHSYPPLTSDCVSCASLFTSHTCLKAAFILTALFRPRWPVNSYNCQFNKTVTVAKCKHIISSEKKSQPATNTNGATEDSQSVTRPQLNHFVLIPSFYHCLIFNYIACVFPEAAPCRGQS